MQFTFTFALQRKELISGCHDLRDMVCVPVREMQRSFALSVIVWSYGDGSQVPLSLEMEHLGPSSLSSVAWHKSRLSVCRTYFLLKAPAMLPLVHPWLLIPLLPLIACPTVTAFCINTSLPTSCSHAPFLASICVIFVL